ncbi:MAG: hypothetical protein KF819_11920 [Labilithrix sp.]|nr:hypothetical protein [Labilithrix sp.]
MPAIRSTHRAGLASLATFATFAAASLGVACSSSDASTSSTDTASSELAVSPSESGASLTIATEDGSCAAAKALVEPRVAELRALCAGGEIALPREVVRDGCEAKAVKSITFRCFVAKRPPPPPEGCQELTIKDEAGALPEDAAESSDALPPLLCPGFDGMQPPPPPGGACDRPDGGEPEGPKGPPPKAAPPIGEGAGPDGAPVGKPGPHRGPPRLQCCVPPRPGGPGKPGGPAPSASPN